MESTVVKTGMKKSAEGYELAGTGEILAYSMGGFGRGIFNAIVMGLLNYFYTNAIGMSAAVVGMIFMFSRVFDGVSDVGVGVLTDKFTTKYGKARNWVLWSSVPFGISTMILFTVPNVSTVGKIIYMAVTYNFATTVMGTLFYVPHMTLAALITRDQNQRTLITIANQILSAISGFLPSLVLLPLVQNLGNTQEAWIKVVGAMVPIGILSMLICFFFTKERVHESAPAEGAHRQKLGFKNVARSLFQNKYWLMVLGIFILDALSNNFFIASGVYYSQYILGNSVYYGTILTANMVPSMIGLFAATPFIKKFTKRSIFLTGAILKLLGLLLVIVLPTGLKSMVISRLIAGFGVGITFSTMYAFIPDTMEYGQWKTGIRLEGILQSACSIGAKIGVGVAPGIVGILMSMGNYDGMAATQPQSALNVIQFCAVWGPAVFAFLMVILICFYDLDKKYPAIMKDLEARKKTAEEN